MNQTQNSEADRKNYFDRAFGVDSNMQHHLACDCREAEFALLQKKLVTCIEQRNEFINDFYSMALYEPECRTIAKEKCDKELDEIK